MAGRGSVRKGLQLAFLSADAFPSVTGQQDCGQSGNKGLPGGYWGGLELENELMLHCTKAETSLSWTALSYPCLTCSRPEGGTEEELWALGLALLCSYGTPPL